MTEVLKFGSNEVVALAPDLYEIRYIDEMTYQPMAELIDYFRQQSSGREYILVLGDAGRGGGISSEARKLVTQAAGISLRGIAFYNASFANKVAAKVVLMAFKLVAKLPFEVHFADSREEALAWLEALRQKPVSTSAQAH